MIDGKSLNESLQQIFLFYLAGENLPVSLYVQQNDSSSFVLLSSVERLHFEVIVMNGNEYNVIVCHRA